ncbi:MAG: methionine--tRNA ligase [Nannocystaceae bacterium]
MPTKVLVTAALPYANGSIHLGHVFEAVQTDVYVRARKLAGDDVVFMWADDSHGTPVQARARKEGISPEELIEKAYDEHVAVYRDFGIGYDIFHTTHSDESRRRAGEIFQTMESSGHITTRDVEQFYCTRDNMFLPDRFVRGICPKCDAEDQYGDACERCGSIYASTELGHPRCSICGEPPTRRSSGHLFVPLAPFEGYLRGWIAAEAGPLQPQVANYVLGWIDSGLREWDISRDEPYFGIPIPGHPGKYFYVWFDAPIGYIAATEKWCQESGGDFNAYWKSTPPQTEIVHVIGKDIVYFHCLFWPAILHAVGYTAPSRVQVHGWVTVNGEKMSKSRGTFILARTYLDHLSPSYLRYYFASKLGSGQDDVDFSFEDFVNKVNADLVNKAANLASRCCKFIHSRLGGTLAALPDDANDLVARGRARLESVADLYRDFELGRSVRLAIEIAEDANLYVTEQAPWKLAKSDPERARAICSVGVWASTVVASILKPVLPQWAETTERMLRLDAPLDFSNGASALPEGHRIGEYEILAERIDAKKLEAISEASREPDPASSHEKGSDANRHVPELAGEIKIDQFSPVDLRVGEIQTCEIVEGSSKLLRLTVGLGELGERCILSGIAKSYTPEDLVGKRVVVLANLKPRKMRFGISEGMILAAGETDDAITVLELDAGRCQPGEKVS